MAFQKRTAIVAIAALVMIVSMTMSEVEARLSVGRNLIEATSERRYLTDIVDKVVGKHCCNKVITRCCAPAPAPTPTRKLAASTTTSASAPKTSKASPPKSKSPKSKDGESSPKSKNDNKKSSSKAKTPKAAPSRSRSASPKSKAAQAPKAMRGKTTVQKN